MLAISLRFPRFPACKHIDRKAYASEEPQRVHARYHRASQLHNVMERGLGSPVVMAILYMEVAARAGLPLQPLLLDGGRYCLLFPGGVNPAGLAGSALPPRPLLLIDPYDKGNLLGAREVRRQS